MPNHDTHNPILQDNTPGRKASQYNELMGHECIQMETEEERGASWEASVLKAYSSITKGRSEETLSPPQLLYSYKLRVRREELSLL